jgi:hypothetical protein
MIRAARWTSIPTYPGPSSPGSPVLNAHANADGAVLQATYCLPYRRHRLLRGGEGVEEGVTLVIDLASVARERFPNDTSVIGQCLSVSVLPQLAQ